MRLRPPLYGAVAAAIAACAFAHPARAEDSDSIASSAGNQISLPKDCADALASNARALQIVSLKYSIAREYRVPGLPRAKHDDIFFYLHGDKFFLRRARTLPSPAGDGDRVHEEEMAFDGRTFYLGNNGKSGQSRLFKILGENPDDPYGSHIIVDHPYLNASGYSPPQTAMQWMASGIASTVIEFATIGELTAAETTGTTLALRLKIPEPYVASARMFDLDRIADEQQRGGAEPAEIEERIADYRRVRALDWHRQVELWLDSEKGYAVTRRRDTNPQGKLIRTTECSDFVQTGQARLWVPRRCIVKTFLKAPQFLEGFTDVPNETDRIELQEITFQPREEVAFALDYGAGTLVTDRSTKEARASPTGDISYTVPAEHDALRKVALDARPAPWSTLFLLTNGLVLFGLVGLVWYNLRRPTKV